MKKYENWGFLKIAFGEKRWYDKTNYITENGGDTHGRARGNNGRLQKGTGCVF